MKKETLRTIGFFILIITSGTGLFADTWYVDPVNGDDGYDGHSPFPTPYFNEGTPADDRSGRLFRGLQ